MRPGMKRKEYFRPTLETMNSARTPDTNRLVTASDVTCNEPTRNRPITTITQRDHERDPYLSRACVTGARLHGPGGDVDQGGHDELGEENRDDGHHRQQFDDEGSDHPADEEQSQPENQ